MADASPSPGEMIGTLSDATRIFVPDDLTVMSTYVFLEQETWFEAEVPFIRRLARSGLRAIDIGANLGFYTLMLARGAGSSGHVWSFEPAPPTAQLLRTSIVENELSNVTVCEAAVGRRSGVVSLGIGHSPELSSLAVTAGQPQIDVPGVSLDELFSRGEIARIDFVKIDAEGAEAEILDGAGAFLGRESPLVMFEIQSGQMKMRELVGRFGALGYSVYRCVPLLQALVPYEGAFGAPSINLFACKPDRAARLAAEGLLCDAPETVYESVEASSQRLHSYLGNL